MRSNHICRAINVISFLNMYNFFRIMPSLSYEKFTDSKVEAGAKYKNACNF